MADLLGDSFASSEAESEAAAAAAGGWQEPAAGLLWLLLFIDSLCLLPHLLFSGPLSHPFGAVGGGPGGGLAGAESGAPG